MDDIIYNCTIMRLADNQLILANTDKPEVACFH